MSASSQSSVSMTTPYPKNRLFSDEFLRQIPKTDLHCHLDGSVRVQTLIDLCREQDLPLPAYTVEELNEVLFKDEYNSLEEYLECFGYVTAALRTADALERAGYEFAVDQYDIGVRYFECRFAPQLNATPGKLNVEEVLLAVNRGLNRATEEFNARPEVVSGEEPEYDYGIIVCAMRFWLPNFSPFFEMFHEMHKHEEPRTIYGLASMSLVSTAHDVKIKHGVPIVGLDIAGAEDGYPAEDHSEAYAFAHKRWIHKTVHAGESYGPESIFQAITDLHAERIGHGLHLFAPEYVNHEKNAADAEKFVEDLTEFIANNRICIEVCLSSNLQVKPELKGDLLNHPFKRMLSHRLAVTICTDNCTVSKTNMVRELRLCCDAFELSPYQLKDIVIGGFKRSFMNRPYTEKRRYNHKIIAYYDKLARKNGIHEDPNRYYERGAMESESARKLLCTCGAAAANGISGSENRS